MASRQFEGFTKFPKTDIVNWQPGQRIVITTTEVKDSRDWHRNEERTIVAVKKTSLGNNVCAIQIDSPLTYVHFGGMEYQAEVSARTRPALLAPNFPFFNRYVRTFMLLPCAFCAQLLVHFAHMSSYWHMCSVISHIIIAIVVV